MEAPSIRQPSSEILPLQTPEKKHPQTIVIHNGINCNSDDGNYPLSLISDFGIVDVQASAYTSLKDIIPPYPPSPPAAVTPPWSRKDSLEGIPIKNPLVKQAALAYLQPMSTPTEIEDRSWFVQLKDKCCLLHRGDADRSTCFDFLNDIVLSPAVQAFRRIFGISSTENKHVD
ncbi:hypothetical protein Nepgr_015357 [Nepenthes gracilis]|uniref:Uncharacterized protein n=1 Tax=Nepenthes gracilis TaxID=150966 RepID=A0AAD3XR81_NEPGR|nr:hypothetical protein Nepgr_015357 [Nepenthes gracilis]